MVGEFRGRRKAGVKIRGERSVLLGNRNVNLAEVWWEGGGWEQEDGEVGGAAPLG